MINKKIISKFTEFEFIKHLNFLNKCSRFYSNSSNFIIIIWILFKRNRESNKYDIKDKFFNNKNYIYDLKIHLQEKFIVFKNVQKIRKIEIYTISDSDQYQFLLMKTAFKDLKITNKIDFLVQYLLLNTNSK